MNKPPHYSAIPFSESVQFQFSVKRGRTSDPSARARLRDARSTGTPERMLLVLALAIMFSGIVGAAGE